MTMRFHNTRTRKKEIFEPRNSGAVGLYTCGPSGPTGSRFGPAIA